MVFWRVGVNLNDRRSSRKPFTNELKPKTISITLKKNRNLPANFSQKDEFSSIKLPKKEALIINENFRGLKTNKI